MLNRYSFFRDDDETAVAILGETAISDDLNGNYQKPYAVLSQRRLYCKGNRLVGGRTEHGNFIVEKSEILSSSNSKKPILYIMFLLLSLLGLAFSSCAAIQIYKMLCYSFGFVFSFQASFFALKQLFSIAPVASILGFASILADVTFVILFVIFLWNHKKEIALITFFLRTLVLCFIFFLMLVVRNFPGASYVGEVKDIVFWLALCLATLIISAFLYRYINFSVGSKQYDKHTFVISTMQGDFVFYEKDYSPTELSVFSKQITVRK